MKRGHPISNESPHFFRHQGFNFMKKNDILFICAVILLITGVLITFSYHANSDNKIVVIKEANDIYGTYPLSEDKKIEVEGILGVTTVIIENGEAYVFDSPCPNKTCIHMGKIKKRGDTIVCIPNRILMSVK